MGDPALGLNLKRITGYFPAIVVLFTTTHAGAGSVRIQFEIESGNFNHGSRWHVNGDSYAMFYASGVTIDMRMDQQVEIQQRLHAVQHVWKRP